MTAQGAGSPEALLPEIADRMAVRRLVDLYAHYADRRDARGQAARSPRTPVSPSTRATPRATSPSSSCGAAPS
ncbi:hypothetical protein [Streptosporangium sp. 'caverna']|uniref:hypothetical protein n=1 Tax=Streptosporangium sp. 'caverna' TaxID=2202249 RepID=UPI001955068F|nr:hypothetical protein [Streptosporangium sp. 'caverna']